jgi:hypothetical protein
MKLSCVSLPLTLGERSRMCLRYIGRPLRQARFTAHVIA